MVTDQGTYTHILHRTQGGPHLRGRWVKCMLQHVMLYQHCWCNETVYAKTSLLWFQGYYMYIEASHMLPKQSASLMSTELRGSAGPQCLIFFYHVYGSGTGTLNVLLHKGDRERLLWTRQGEQSVSWMKATVDYECYTRHWVRDSLLLTLLLKNAFEIHLL